MHVLGRSTLENSNPSTDSAKEELQRLERLCNQNGSMHGMLAEHYERWSQSLNLGCLASSVALLAFVLATPEYFERALGINRDIYSLIMAAIAVLTTVTSVLAAVWRPQEQASRHRQAVRHYTQCRYRARDMLKGPVEPTIRDVEEFRNQYLDDLWLPTIPDSAFLRLKRSHLLKVACSKSLDEDPAPPIWLVRYRIWRKRRRLPAESPSHTDE